MRFTRNNTDQIITSTPMDFYSEYRAYAENQLHSLLKSCQKTAAVLPEYWAKEIGKDLRRAGLKSVFVGKYRYLNVHHGFFIVGKTHRNVVRRMYAFKSSGIWNWWLNYAEHRFQYNAEYIKEDLAKPSMEGNIQVIFYILLSGIFLSSVSFMAELHKYIFAIIIATYTMICNHVKKFYNSIWLYLISEKCKKEPKTKSKQAWN